MNRIVPLLAMVACLAPAPAGKSASRPATRPDEPFPVTGESHSALAPLDEMMTSFLAAHRLPGAALAVARDGRLVYARGFGYADLDRKTPVQPNALFRIASISKPITAAAVMQLAEAGKVRLDDPALPLLKLSPHLPAGAAPDLRLDAVTIRRLLQHTGGWDRGRSGDLMFKSVSIAEALKVPPPAGSEHIIRYMMGQPLDFDPGERMVYSNLGYCVLGRIVERLTGQPYETYVREHVLAPLGISDMRPGRSLPEYRAENEVSYYTPDGRTGPCVFAGMLDRKVPLPYGTFCVEAADAHGGWLASAPDLARFASAFRDPASCEILKPETFTTMFARPEGKPGLEKDGRPKDVYYACGWMVRRVGTEGRFNAWHNGAIPGTFSLMVRRHDGFAWAVLFNGNDKETGKIDGLIHRAVDSVRTWPSGDLFPACGIVANRTKSGTSGASGK